MKFGGGVALFLAENQRAATQFFGIIWPELQYPSPYRLVGHIQTTLSEQILLRRDS